MEKEIILKNVLKKVFDQITADVKDFIDWYGYKTAEVKLQDMKESIGIGINANYSAIKLFYINLNDYSESDYRRFIQTFRIGSSVDNVNRGYWGVELAQLNLVATVGNMAFINCHFQAAHRIIEIINKEELYALKK